MTLDEKQLKTIEKSAETISKSAETIVSVIRDALGAPITKSELWEWVSQKNDWITIKTLRDQFSLKTNEVKEIVEGWHREELVAIDETTFGGRKRTDLVLTTKFKSSSHKEEELKPTISFFEFIKSLQNVYKKIAPLRTTVHIPELWKNFQLHSNLTKELFESFLVDCFYLFPAQIRLDPADSPTDAGIKIKNVLYAYFVMLQPIYG